MTDKKTKPEPFTMSDFCVSCGNHMTITDVPAKLPATMPAQCDACLASHVPLPAGYEQPGEDDGA